MTNIILNSLTFIDCDKNVLNLLQENRYQKVLASMKQTLAAVLSLEIAFVHTLESIK